MNNLKIYRKLHKLSQEELSVLLGVHRDYISMLERGKRTPGFRLANNIANLFCISVDELNFFPKQSNEMFEDNLVTSKK